MHHAESQAAALQVAAKVRQRVAKSAEYQGFVVGQRSLVRNDLHERFDLGIVGIEPACQLQQIFNVDANLRGKAPVTVHLAVDGLHDLQLIEFAVQDVAKQRRQSVQATGRLSADRGHHELDVLLAVAESQDAGDDVEQAVVKRTLRRGELNRDGLWLACGELTDVPATGAVDQRTEGV